MDQTGIDRKNYLINPKPDLQDINTIPCKINIVFWAAAKKKGVFL